MRHLYNSVGRVKRLKYTVINSSPEANYAVVEGLEAVRCRLDLNFMRPGKDQPTMTESGVAPDRVGVLFCDAGTPLRADDYLELYVGPVQGVFQLRAIPDIAIAYAAGHHMEVQVVETTQNLDELVPMDDEE